METEGVKLNFTKEGIEKIASICWQLNEQHENIGARRIRTVVSKTIEEVSFAANEYEGKEVTIDDKYVAERVQPLLKKIDLNKYII
jgi:ATP-dependent HslUV protease ATP-binding subunit HslU